MLQICVWVITHFNIFFKNSKHMVEIYCNAFPATNSPSKMTAILFSPVCVGGGGGGGCILKLMFNHYCGWKYLCTSQLRQLQF